MKQDNIKVGDFVKSGYKFGNVSGFVLKIGKSKARIQACVGTYGDYIKTSKIVSVTISRIYQIGLLDNERILNPNL
jgi:hypothetical protein